MSTERRGTCVVIRYVRKTDSSTRTSYYGPFLPHCGSAVTGTLAALDQASMADPLVNHAEGFVEDVFISDGESDCAVVAVR